jgi:hypothetical protein
VAADWSAGQTIHTRGIRLGKIFGMNSFGLTCTSKPSMLIVLLWMPGKKPPCVLGCGWKEPAMCVVECH